MNYLPAKLTKLRKHYNYSQSYLAEVLGVETIRYMNYENGSDMIGYDEMKKLASLYHVDIEEIFRNNEEVELYDVKGANTDELNIDYFIPKKTVFDRIRDFIRNHKIVTSIIGGLLAVIAIMSFIIGNNSKPYVPIKDNINRLSVSETTVIYIDDYGGVVGSGSNANGELSNLSASGAIKVCEGEGFSIILNEDGTVSSSGLVSKHEKEISGWTNIKDIAAGDGHVIAVDSYGKVYCSGDDEQGQCQLDGSRNVSKVYATANGSIIMKEDGKLEYSGSFMGSSSLKDYANARDIASSENTLAILDSEGYVHVYSTASNYFQAENWYDIVDVACGNDFVAGLDSFGKVHIEIENDTIRNEISNWTDIIAIDAASNYLIALDGANIYGVGKNRYNQFVEKEIEKKTLPQVSEIKYIISKDYVTISFDGVNNASGYDVSLDVGTGLSHRISEEEAVKFETANMVEGKTYTISIVAIGSGDYKDSEARELSFVYEAYVEMVEIDTIFDKSAEQFEDYLRSLGVDSEHIVSIEEDECSGEYIITMVSGIKEGEVLSLDELLERQIEYHYCKVVDDGQQ